MELDRVKQQKGIRKVVQGLNGLISNAHLTGFVTGKIYSGPLKRFCVPGMNCYACPAAVMSCPIGSMQAVLGQDKPKFSFYVIGFLTFIGVLVGRFICGWLCLFGLIQELLYMIPVPKITVKESVDKVLRYAKYIFLFGFCIFGVLFIKTEFGLSYPYFCKFVCPIGMLEGGIPLLILNAAYRAAAGFLYIWKFIVLIIIVVLSMIINRPFCKYICPLGAFYSLFQKVSFLKLEVDKDSCIDCGACTKSCKMQVNPVKNPNSLECIRCGECVNVCPKSALKFNVANRKVAFNNAIKG